MDTLLFLLFCLAIGYVIVWVIMNERRGNKNGEWGIIAMLVAPEESKRPPGGWQIGDNEAPGSKARARQDRSTRAR